MKLYFLRHATAVDEAPSDEERALTPDGRKEARIAGRALVVMDAAPSCILTSPLVRARQTAEIASEAMKLKEAPIIAHELTNGTPTAALLHVLKKCQDAKRIVLVGHSPSLSDHVASLIGAKSGNALRFGKGAIACVDLEELRPAGGELRWFMGQKLLRLVEKA